MTLQTPQGTARMPASSLYQTEQIQSDEHAAGSGRSHTNSITKQKDGEKRFSKPIVLAQNRAIHSQRRWQQYQGGPAEQPDKKINKSSKPEEN